MYDEPDEIFFDEDGIDEGLKVPFVEVPYPDNSLYNDKYFYGVEQEIKNNREDSLDEDLDFLINMNNNIDYYSPVEDVNAAKINKNKQKGTSATKQNMTKQLKNRTKTNTINKVSSSKKTISTPKNDSKSRNPSKSRPVIPSFSDMEPDNDQGLDLDLLDTSRSEDSEIAWLMDHINDFNDFNINSPKKSRRGNRRNELDVTVASKLNAVIDPTASHRKPNSSKVSSTEGGGGLASGGTGGAGLGPLRTSSYPLRPMPAKMSRGGAVVDQPLSRGNEFSSRGTDGGEDAVQWPVVVPLSPTIKIGSVQSQFAINTADIKQLRTFTTLSPQLWLVTRALYFMLFAYHETMGDSALSFIDLAAAATSAIESPAGFATDENNHHANIKAAGGDAEPTIDMSGFWLLLRGHREKLQLRLDSIFQQYSWPLMQELMGVPKLLAMAMNKQIPQDGIFRRYVPDATLPLMHKTVKSALFRPELLARSSGGNKICKWVRGIAALIWEEKCAMKRGSVATSSIKSFLGEPLDSSSSMQSQSQPQLQPSSKRSKGKPTGTTPAAVVAFDKNTIDRSSSNNNNDDDWMTIPLQPTLSPKSQSQYDMSLPPATWFRVPLSMKKKMKPKFVSCGVDGLSPAFVAFKAACNLCRPIDRMDVIHVYSDNVTARKTRLPSAESANPAADNSNGEAGGAAGGQYDRVVFGADLSPHAIKAMYEAELRREHAASSLRRVICLSRSSGNTIAEEIVSHVNASGCDLLVVGFEHFGSMMGVRPSSVSNMRSTMPLPAPNTSSAAGGVTAGDEAAGSAGPLTSSSRPVTRGDRWRVSAADLRKVNCAILVAKPFIPLTIPESPRPTPAAGYNGFMDQRDSGDGSSTGAANKWVVAVGSDFIDKSEVEAGSAGSTSSQMAVELAVSLAKPGDLILLLHIAGRSSASSSNSSAKQKNIDRARQLVAKYMNVYGLAVQVEFLETFKDSHSSDMLTSKLVEVVGDINPNFAVFGAGGRKGRQKDMLRASPCSLAESFVTSCGASVSVVVARPPAAAASSTGTTPAAGALHRHSSLHSQRK